MEAALAGERLYIVTCQDIAPIGCTAWKPLPIFTSDEDREPLTVHLGTVEEGEGKILCIGLDGGCTAENLIVTANGVPLSGFVTSEIGKDFAFSCFNLYERALPAEVFGDSCDSVTLTFDDTTTVVNKKWEEEQESLVVAFVAVDIP